MATPPHDGELERLLDYLHERRYFDFRGYKRASLSRRIFKRMQAVGAEDYGRYMEILEANPGEFVQLFDSILINVTAFVRDRDAWDVLAHRVVPEIASSKEPHEPIRVWSAGCASGEEAYSLAVIFADALGEDRFRRVVKIYATDADGDALVQARHGRYPERDLAAAFGEERTGRFFELEGSVGTMRGDLRRALIFGRHDLGQDPPISRIDLMVCRNTLMYFTAEMQRRVLGSFNFALNPGGYLFLGKSEALVTRTHLFEVVDLHQHIFRKDHNSARAVSASPQKATRTAERAAPGPEPAFEQAPFPQLVVDMDGNVVQANRLARRLLGLGTNDAGRDLRSLPDTMVPGDLAAIVERATRERRSVTVEYIPSTHGGESSLSFDVLVGAFDSPEGGASVVWMDVTRFQHLRDELEESRRELESAYEELQSAVEELETTNEELQSTNEELETINNALREQTTEVEELNHFQDAVLSGLRSAVVVLGTDMDVRAWNRQAQDLWGLRSDEVIGQHFLNLDIGLPVDQLRGMIRDVTAGRVDSGKAEVEAVNRRGRRVTCAVYAAPLTTGERADGVILIMDAGPVHDGAGTAAAAESEEPA